MYQPSREEFVRAAEQGNLIPVYRELLADGDTPVSAYAALGRADHTFLLESVVGGATWAAYSFVGVAPRAILRCQGGKASATWFDVDGGGPARTAEWDERDPTRALREVMGDFRPVETAGLPRFWGGAVGWITYDVVRAFEDLPARARADVALPELCMVVTDTLIIFDNLRQTLKVVATPYVPRPERAEQAYDRAIERIEAVIATLRGPRARLTELTPPVPGEPSHVELPSSTFAKDAYCAAVERVKEYILAGDAFQVVLSQRFATPRDVDGFDVYRALRVINPSPYMFHLRFPDAEVTGASPETLVRLSAGRVELRPIAGTRPRGANPDDDERLAAELLADPKERAEHYMLIDLGRNDVGRVAEVGSVRVTEQLGDRALLARHAHGLARGRAARRRQDLARRAARGVPRRDAVGRAQDPRDGDHRRARADPPRGCTAARWATSATGRQHGLGDRDPHAGRARRTDLRPGRRAASSPTRCPSRRVRGNRSNKARAVLRAVEMARGGRSGEGTEPS